MSAATGRRASGGRSSVLGAATAPDGASAGVVLTLPEPPSANRWWRHVGNRVVTSQAAREYKQRVAYTLLAMRVAQIPADVAVCVTITWYRARRSGDLDKRLGVLLDALQGTAYVNDGQITEIRALRIDGDVQRRGHVTLTIAPAEVRP